MAAHHALSEAVETILPAASETLLLLGCLDATEAGQRALERWLLAQPDAVAALTRAPVKWMLPLVHRACRQHHIEPSSAVATLLRTASLREELRAPSYRTIRRSMLETLARAGVHPIVLKGAALGDLVYPNASLRHAHDVELMVCGTEWDRLPAALAPFGLPKHASIDHSARVEVIHASGLPMVVHRRLFYIPFYNVEDEAVWRRTETVMLGGYPARVLSPADALVHACGHALHSIARDSYRWIVDAWFLVKTRPDLDWDGLARAAEARHMTLPLAVSLAYLAEALAAPVPKTVRDRLVAMAAQDRSVGPELALHGARVATGAGVHALVRRTRTMRGRAAIFRHLLLPSMSFLSWATRPRSPLLRATHGRMFRAARYIRRRLNA